MSKMTLSQRLTLVFILLLLACSVISGVMQVRSSDRFSQAVIQRLSANLATQIAANNPLLSQNGLDPNAVHNLFNQLMAVNPSVEVYLLDSEGDIVGNAAPAGKLLRQKIDLTPVHELLNGKTMPVYGDNPRTTDQRQVFSAAPLKSNGVLKGYVYIVLLGDAGERRVERAVRDVRENRRGVQRALDFGDVVDVGDGSRHLRAGAFMRVRCADCGLGGFDVGFDVGCAGVHADASSGCSVASVGWPWLLAEVSSQKRWNNAPSISRR